MEFCILCDWVVLSTASSQLEYLFSSKIEIEQWLVEQGKYIYIPYSRRILLWQIRSRARVQFQAAFIDVKNKPRLASTVIDRVAAHVSWYDKHDSLITSNYGRWWISNENQYVDTHLLQAVDLYANGVPRRLYFARIWNGRLNAWHRTADKKEPEISLADSRYIVVIEFRANSGQRAKLETWVSFYNGKLELQKRSRWQKFIGTIKRRLR